MLRFDKPDQWTEIDDLPGSENEYQSSLMERLGYNSVQLFGDEHGWSYQLWGHSGSPRKWIVSVSDGSFGEDIEVLGWPSLICLLAMLGQTALPAVLSEDGRLRVEGREEGERHFEERLRKENKEWRRRKAAQASNVERADGRS